MKVLAKFSQKWTKIGQLLKIEKQFLDHLSGERMLPRDCLEKVFSQWLRAQESTASWDYLIKVLRSNQNDLPGVADRVIGFLALPEIHKKYE